MNRPTDSPWCCKLSVEPHETLTAQEAQCDKVDVMIVYDPHLFVLQARGSTQAAVVRKVTCVLTAGYFLAGPVPLREIPDLSLTKAAAFVALPGLFVTGKSSQSWH